MNLNQQVGRPLKGKGFPKPNNLTPQNKTLAFPNKKVNLHNTKCFKIQF